MFEEYPRKCKSCCTLTCTGKIFITNKSFEIIFKSRSLILVQKEYGNVRLIYGTAKRTVYISNFFIYFEKTIPVAFVSISEDIKNTAVFHLSSKK